MIFRRFLILLLAVFLLAQTGCYYTNNVFTRGRLYRKVVVTDLEGTLISSWIAEGPVWSYAPGYRFRAMERLSGGPIPVKTRYPNGWNVKVNGPNIVVMPCEKPQWLRDLDGF